MKVSEAFYFFKLFIMKKILIFLCLFFWLGFYSVNASSYSYNFDNWTIVDVSFDLSNNAILSYSNMSYSWVTSVPGIKKIIWYSNDTLLFLSNNSSYWDYIVPCYYNFSVNRISCLTNPTLLNSPVVVSSILSTKTIYVENKEFIVNNIKILAPYQFKYLQKTWIDLTNSLIFTIFCFFLFTFSIYIFLRIFIKFLKK